MSDNEITIKYNYCKDQKKYRIFGENFVKNNKKNCQIVFQNKKLNLAEKLNFKSNDSDKVEIKLIVINNITNMSALFYECKNLISSPDLSKLNTSNVTDMNGMFSKCTSLISLPDISKWNTNNVTDMRWMFLGCNPSLKIPKKFK